MNKLVVHETFQNLTLALLKQKELFINEEKILNASLKIFETHSILYVIFELKRKSHVIESLKFSEAITADKLDYVLEINLFLVRLYNTLEQHLGSKAFVHMCPGCKKAHVNQSMYFDRNYVCNTCLDPNSTKRKAFVTTSITDTGDIYFFESALTKLIKIGYSGNIPRRRKEIESMQGGKINILLKINSHQRNEKYLHERFNHLKVQGEWFRPDEELLNFIRNFKSFNDENIK